MYSLTTCDSRFLLTASEPTYRILTTGALTAEQRTFLVLDPDPLSNGTICDIDVSTFQMVHTYSYMKYHAHSTPLGLTHRAYYRLTNSVCEPILQDFMELEMDMEVENETNGILVIRDENGTVLGDISCMFDEFITSK